jgi:hypothetical protein
MDLPNIAQSETRPAHGRYAVSACISCKRQFAPSRVDCDRCHDRFGNPERLWLVIRWYRDGTWFQWLSPGERQLANMPRPEVYQKTPH